MPKKFRHLTRDWGSAQDVDLYLDRCQVDTPAHVVKQVWKLIRARRRHIGKVVDFGAGDGRFATMGQYKEYVGYEIDSRRSHAFGMPSNARIEHRCAFVDDVDDADVCLGNPPYVRNQDLPIGWRERAADVIAHRTAVTVSGLANAWQYFAFLALSSTKPHGLVALVMPYEWVSRPGAKQLRTLIADNGWDVDIYRLSDTTFHRVLTTSAITIIDKARATGRWRYFVEDAPSTFRPLTSPSGSREVLRYTPRAAAMPEGTAHRGLSPGTQEVLTLTEGERVRNGLRVGADVVACVTTLRGLDPGVATLTRQIFNAHYREVGAKCWLIRTDYPPSARLRSYLDSVPKRHRQTATCLARDDWWRFVMPAVPTILVATGFRGPRPKVVRNAIGARAVGGVAGVFGVGVARARDLTRRLRGAALGGRIVAHSNGLRKLEIGQLQTLVTKALVVSSRS